MRSLLGRPLDELTLEELRHHLSAAGDEDDRWEAKSEVTPKIVFRAVAGLANRDGGLLVIGAAPAGGTGWTLNGAAFPGEPRPWVARVIRDNLRPAPPYDLQVFEIAPGLHAAIIGVERHASHLTITSEGRVLVRDHGSTEPVADGAELTRLIRARSGVGPATKLDPDLGADEVGDAALAVIQSGNDATLRSFLVGLQLRIVRAAEHLPPEALSTEADRLSAIAGSLAQAAPDSPLMTVAITAHHRVLDAASRLQVIPGARPDIDLFRVTLRNARALGALLVRMELWDEVRKLAAFELANDDGIPPGWTTYAGAREARLLNRPSNAEQLRQPVREAVATGLRVSALHPDGADEHQILDAVLVFDLLANLVELDLTADQPLEGRISPDFAVFGPAPHRPIVARVLDDAVVRQALLPGRSEARAAQLLLSVDSQANRVANACAAFWHGIADRATEAKIAALTAADW